MFLQSELARVVIGKAETEAKHSALKEVTLQAYGEHLRAKLKANRLDDELDIVRFHLMQRYSWLPAAVRSMSIDDMYFALSDELAGFKVPEELLQEFSTRKRQEPKKKAAVKRPGVSPLKA